MNIPFQTYPRAVKSENRRLKEILGYREGYPWYQWAWSEDLWMPTIKVDELGQPIYDYHCACGVNVSVHSATCSFTAPKPAWEMIKLVNNMKDKWVLCVWVRPEFSPSEWEHFFGGSPYPENGYYFPVGTATQCIATIGIPERATTDECARHIKEHFSVSAKERSRKTKENWKQKDIARRRVYEIMVRDAFPVHEGFPGAKENWSAGGIGPSPVEKQLVELAK